ncbi:FAD-binding oxidoreductase [Rossellomorea vietnamensis]|uniref:FAD-binding oxidoreductase n=1 Tax=Rossellomorea vietnamensis TaxID=218284 RepID=A0A5D4NJ95_9BACI|nr:FAD-dependent oxidoreductase [Rossellomorea vietnamensis]TYS14080.1 FAD-binding oxidoreductase [Rossellomorea vietnamensis]
MKLHNGSLYWPTTFTPTENEEKAFLPDDHYDAVIAGAGLSGVLCAYTLVEAGLKVALVDKRAAGAGSSSANTGLLQYSNDIMLHELINQIGENRAVTFYKLCLEAVDHLEKAADSIPFDVDFKRRNSICFASKEEDAGKLHDEYEALKKHGFPVHFWTDKDLEKHMPFTKPAALVTQRDAEVNPYRFVMGIMQFLREHGADLFEHTEVTNTVEKEDYIVLETSRGNLKAKHVIFCTGYEASMAGKSLGTKINRSYAIATEPVADLSAWWDRALIWETDRPYFYLRTTNDNRIIAGGLDEEIPHAPESREIIDRHGKRIADEIRKLFPHLDIAISHAWGASFGESLDNLPFIGLVPGKERTYCLLGYGGNGTVYSMLGAKILADLLQGNVTEGADIVKLER